MTERTDGGRGDHSGRKAESRKRRRRGVPKPEWGDNVIEADFGARRRGVDTDLSRVSASTDRVVSRSPLGEVSLSPRRGQQPDQPPISEENSQRHRVGSQETRVSHATISASSLSDSWVGRQILEAVSLSADTARRSRGREYFRAGKVHHLDFDYGIVSSLVAGSQLEPFEVSLRWRPLTTHQVAYIRGECLAHPESVSQLLAGREPRQDVAAVLCRPGDFQESWCTCPDRSGMCKHRVAVACALAEKFTSDPIAFLDWRGLDTRQLIAELDALAGAVGTDNDESNDEPGSEAPQEEEQRYSSQEFWGDLNQLPRWDSLDVERGLDLGDLDARNAVIRKVSWNTVDQLRVLDELQSCYDLLIDDAAALGDSPFTSEPWLSRQDDRISDHD